MLLHAGVQPLDRPNDALKVAQVRIRSKTAVIFRHSQRTVGMGLRQVNQRPDLPGFRCVDVAADQSIDQRRLPYPRRALDQQPLEWRHADYPALSVAILPLTTAQAAAVYISRLPTL